MRIISLLLLSSLLMPAVLSSQEVLNRVIAVVGNRPITLIDLERQKEILKKRRDVKKDKRNLESQVIDLLISREIVNLVAYEESITVPPERVEGALEKEMQSRGYDDLDKYKRKIKRETGLSWRQYRAELRRQLQTQQVIQLRVSVPNPSPAQVREWYNVNKAKLGEKYLVRVVQMKFNRNDPKDELRVSRAMKKARSLARRNFAAAAEKYSDHPSKSRGGLLGWRRLDQIARTDPILAGAVQRTREGRVSQVFVGRSGYYIVKVEEKSNIPVEEVYEQIRALLYRRNEQEAFHRWVQEQRTRISVKIYYDDYEES